MPILVMGDGTRVAAGLYSEEESAHRALFMLVAQKVAREAVLSGGYYQKAYNGELDRLWEGRQKIRRLLARHRPGVLSAFDRGQDRKVYIDVEGEERCDGIRSLLDLIDEGIRDRFFFPDGFEGEEVEEQPARKRRQTPA